MADSLLILSNPQIKQKLNRMAYQVYEQNFDADELIIAGISSRGYEIASAISKILEDISPLKIKLLEVKVDKREPLASPVEISPSGIDFKGKIVLLVDDVLNTGRTLTYATIPFLQSGVEKLQTLVLVQRHHTNFPVMPDFVGLSLATTLQEHITVELNKDNSGVYLS